MQFSSSKKKDIIKRKIQQGAIDFVKDYCNILKNHIDKICFKKFEMSFIFEQFLCNPGDDLKMFENSYFDGIFDGENIYEYMNKYIKHN